MDAATIRSIAMDGAEKYFGYLALNNKGLQEVDVLDIRPQEGSGKVYQLRLGARLFDLDSIFFKLLPDDRRIPTTEIPVVEYDPDKHLLIIKPMEDLQTCFQRLAARDIRVISDLKFLIERVRVWYERHGGELVFPTTASKLVGTLEQLQYLPGKEPSADQKKAIRLAFQAPFAYIWGAPGTGKTQFVLSYSVLHYLNERKRVAILAPTNNSLEQVLRGVLSMMDLAGVERTRVLRLGVPSRLFAEEYPEVCEERGVMKKLEELHNQLSSYRRILTLLKKRDQLVLAEQKLEIFDRLISISEQITRLRPTVETGREEFLLAETAAAKVSREIQSIEAKKTAAEREMKTIGHRIGKWFSKGSSQPEREREAADQALIELQIRHSHWKQERAAKEAGFHQIKRSLSALEGAFQDGVDSAKRELDGIEEATPLLRSWKGEDPDTLRKAVTIALHLAQVDLEQTEGLYQEYRHYPSAEMEEVLQHLEGKRERLVVHSTEERLKEVGVVACTLDGYVGRFTDNRLNVDHLFLDEAGYANISKALTLFNNKVPITFLGDHMQLPPVCEMSDSVIQENPDYRNVFLWAQSAIFTEGMFQKTRDELLMDYLKNAPFSATRMMQTALKRTFRFGRRLAGILDAHVYRNGFVSGEEQGETRIYYIHAPKTEASKSRVSAAEVQAIRQLVEGFGDQEDFIILTPYKRQVQALGKALPRERNELKILTIHGSQGREWDTVILSVVDTYDKWFVDSQQPLSNGLNVLNTAISRTRRRLIIVCDHLYWRGQAGQLVTDLLAGGTLIR